MNERRDVEEKGIDDQVQYAGFWIRTGAIIIDGFVLLPLGALEYYNKTSMHSISILLVGTLLTICYKPLLEYLYGATIGKQLVGIRVVSEQFNALTMNQAFLRYMPWLISATFSFLLGMEYYLKGEYADNIFEISESMQESFWTEISSLYLFIFIGIVSFAAFDAKRQGIHDKLAKTYCIYN